MLKVKYKIFQMPERTEYRFMNWDWASKHGFSFGDYEEVYSGEKEKERIFPSLWEEFNLYHPSDFRGHSLSVSDIVAIKDNGDWRYYYCDSVGWEDITNVIEIDGVLVELED